MMSFLLMAIVEEPGFFGAIVSPLHPVTHSSVGCSGWFGWRGLETTDYLQGTNPAEVVSYAPTIPTRHS